MSGEQHACAWELTEEAWLAWAGVSEAEACDSGTTTAWLIYLPARDALPPIQLPALGALTPPKLPARPARGAQLKVVLDAMRASRTIMLLCAAERDSHNTCSC